MLRFLIHIHKHTLYVYTLFLCKVFARDYLGLFTLWRTCDKWIWLVSRVKLVTYSILDTESQTLQNILKGTILGGKF